MRNIRTNGSSRGYGNKGHRSGYSSAPRRNKRYSYTWSESDLIKSIEYSHQTPIIQTEDKYTPAHTFEDFDFNPILKQNIRRKNYTELSPVQDQAIPSIIAGKDLVGIANTGTGKTAAFLLPLIDKVSKNRKQKVLIIAPTRELAEQINNDFRIFTAGMGIYSTLIIGGANSRRQAAELNRKPSFVVGTPGRLKDMIQHRNLNLTEFENVVLDEADRMVDIGFIKEIRYFISLLPKVRQSLFFSATVSKGVQEILDTFVQNPVVVNVKKQETGINIKQELIKIPRNESKLETLHKLLLNEEYSKVIVFGNSKWDIQKLADEIARRGHKADAIHGNKRQNQRHAILERFKKNEFRVLFATDVAARGLDIKNVSHVINYELPNTYDDYVHRIGRTGRADKTGVALTFVSA